MRENFSPYKSYELTNSNGVAMTFTPYGGKVISLRVPDRNGKLDDIMLGFDTVEQYHHGNPYFGAIIGRYANRIRHGSFALEDKRYQLSINNGINTLHGGPQGFHQTYWQLESISRQSAVLILHSKDGEEGFPGNLTVKVTYLLTDQNEWIIDYEATSDKTTVINLTHHAFFNLKGEGNGDVLDHELMLMADRYCPIDETLIPTGEMQPVNGTPFDFKSFSRIGNRIGENHLQLNYGKGYDHNWILNGDFGSLKLAAKVKEPTTGRIMEVLTTEPGLQFYSGNFLNGSDVGKRGKPYGFRSAFCLEAQHFPDSPNNPHFPSTVLLPGQIYTQRTIYWFKHQ